MARPIANRLNPAPMRRMMARPVSEVGPLANLPIGLLFAAAAGVVVIVIVLLATRGDATGEGEGEVAGGRSSVETAGEELPVPIRFGTAVDPVTGEVEGDSVRFVRGQEFAYSIRLPQAVDTDAVDVEVIHRSAEGGQVVVQPAASQPVNPALRVIAFQVTADALIDGFGPGDFQMRIYRGRELIAQGYFTLAES